MTVAERIIDCMKNNNHKEFGKFLREFSATTSGICLADMIDDGKGKSENFYREFFDYNSDMFNPAFASKLVNFLGFYLREIPGDDWNEAETITDYWNDFFYPELGD